MSTDDPNTVVASPPSSATNFWRATQFPALIALLLAIAAWTITRIADRLTAAPTITWSVKQGSSSPHAQPAVGETAGTIIFRNLTYDRAFYNLGVTLRTDAGELRQGWLDPDPRLLLTAGDSRKVSQLKTGDGATVPYRLVLHVPRLDPRQELTVSYVGADLGNVWPSMRAGVNRNEWLLRPPKDGDYATGKDDQAVHLQPWNGFSWIVWHEIGVLVSLTVILAIAIVVLTLRLRH